MPDPEVFDQIRRAVVDAGALSKSEIVTTWDLTEEGYEAVKAYFRRDPGIKPGPPRVGGFIVHLKRYREQGPAEGVARSAAVGSDWEQAGGLRLAELLSGVQLHDLLGTKLANALRLDVKRRTGRDVPPRKDDLALALIVKHGQDLLADKEVRSVVARAARVAPVERWHPGKTAAIEFARAAGFGLEFAGIPSEETPPSYEYLRGKVALKELEDFQHEVARKLRQCLNSLADGRAIVTLPTGAGKTRVAVETIRSWLTDQDRDTTCRQKSVLWLAHSSELCDQAYLCFKHVWENADDVCDLLLMRFWGDFTRDFSEHRSALRDVLTRPSVLVSTPHRLAGLIRDDDRAVEDVLVDLVASTALIVVDEAHRAAAPSYRAIFERFATPRIVGLTATPFRMEYQPLDPEAGTKELYELFLNLIEPRETLGDEPRIELQQRGVLARPRVETIATATVLQAPAVDDLDNIRDDDIERIDQALRVRADNPTRRQTIYEALLERCGQRPDASVLYFGPSVADAECMAFLLRSAGIPAAAVTGQTRDVTRRQIVRDFKERTIQVLCNCEVLTTGFDAPRVTHVMMARPTVSRVLYEQMVGRGLRGPRFGGTEECVIIDCEDNYRSQRPELGYKAFRHLWNVDRG